MAGAAENSEEFGIVVKIDHTQIRTSGSNDKTLAFTVTETNGVLNWKCTTDSINARPNDSIEAEHLPDGCEVPTEPQAT